MNIPRFSLRTDGEPVTQQQARDLEIAVTAISTELTQGMLSKLRLLTPSPSGEASVNLPPGKGDPLDILPGDLWHIGGTLRFFTGTDTKTLAFSEDVTTQLALKAPLASPTFTGTVTAPTINATTALTQGGTAVSLAGHTHSHTALTDIGTNTHAQIDTALTRLANTSGTNTGDQTVPATTTRTANSFFTSYSAGTFGQSTIAAADLPSGIDATKIADGTVTSTEFQYINSVTSNVQNQLNAKAALAGAAFTGNVSTTGTLQVDGNTILGNTSGDTITVNATPTFLAETLFGKRVRLQGNDFAIAILEPDPRTTTAREFRIYGCQVTTATDVAGGNLSLFAGAGTGAGAGSIVRILSPSPTTSGTTSQGQYLRMSVGETISLLADTTASYNMTVNGTFTANGNITLGNAAADTITVTGTPTFAENVTMSKALTVKSGTNFTLQDPTTTTKQMQFSLAGLTAATTRTITVPDASGTISLTGHTHTASDVTDFSTAADARITAQKGAASGLATLDSGGKVPVAQLPNSIMEYQGTWNASTNTPTLADGTGSAGDVYRVSVSATRNLGSGNIDFVVGDYAIYNGSTWEKADTTDAVSTVFGRSGNVVAASNDYTWAQIDKTTSSIADITTKSHTALTDIGTNTHAQIDTALTRLANTSGTNTGDQTVPANTTATANQFFTAYSAGSFTKAQPTWANIDKTTSNIADITTKSHTSLTDIGTNTHAQIDTALTRLANTSGTNTGDQVVPANTASSASNFFTAYNSTTGAFTKAAVVAGDITSGTFAIAQIPTGTTSTTVALGNHLHSGVYEPVFTTLSSKTIDNTNTITIKSGSFTLQDPTTTSKQVQFGLSLITAATTRTITVPDASGTMTLLGNAATGSGSVVLATSPQLLGVPLSTTAAVNTSSTQIATTAFVIGQGEGTTPPNGNGTAATGSSSKFSRQDHVHPTDTTRAALAGATFTGSVTVNSDVYLGTGTGQEILAFRCSEVRAVGNAPTYTAQAALGSTPLVTPNAGNTNMVGVISIKPGGTGITTGPQLLIAFADSVTLSSDYAVFLTPLNGAAAGVSWYVGTRNTGAWYLAVSGTALTTAVTYTISYLVIDVV